MLEYVISISPELKLITSTNIRESRFSGYGGFGLSSVLLDNMFYFEQTHISSFLNKWRCSHTSVHSTYL